MGAIQGRFFFVITAWKLQVEAQKEFEKIQTDNKYADFQKKLLLFGRKHILEVRANNDETKFDQLKQTNWVEAHQHLLYMGYKAEADQKIRESINNDR